MKNGSMPNQMSCEVNAKQSKKSGRGWNLVAGCNQVISVFRYYNSVSDTGYSCSTVKAGSGKMLVTAPRVLESMESTIASLNSHALAAT